MDMQYYLIYFVAEVVPTLAIVGSFQLASECLLYTPIIWFIFLPQLLYFLYYKMFQAHLVYFLPHSFLRVPSVGERYYKPAFGLGTFITYSSGVINQHLGIRCILMTARDVVSTSQLTEQGHMYIY